MEDNRTEAPEGTEADMETPILVPGEQPCEKEATDHGSSLDAQWG